MGEETPTFHLPSPEVRKVQAFLYKSLMEGSLTTDMLLSHEQYLDMDFKIACCTGCPIGPNFEECVYSNISFEDMLNQHVDLIQTGYCSCGHVDNSLKTQVVGFKLIHRIVANDNNLRFLAFLQELKCDFNASTLHFKNTPILIAITQNQIRTVAYLARNGAEINQGDGPINRMSPLCLALRLNFKTIVRILLSAKNIDVNSLLDWCIMARPMYTEMLLKAGADPNTVDDGQVTPLMRCTYTQNTDLVKLLIKHGADVNKGDDRDEGPILISARRGDVNTTTVLLEAGANPNCCTKTTNESPILLASSAGSTELIKLLMKYGSQVDFINKSGYSALHNAAWGGHCETVKLLLELGVPHDIQTECKSTPLSLAAYNAKIDVMKILLPLGCDVNNPDDDGDTPLHYFAQSGIVEGVRLLLEFDANPDICNDYGCSVLWRAVYWEQKEVVKQLLAANVKLDVPSRGMIRHLLNRRIIILYDTPKTPLYVAVKKHTLDIAMLLVTAGCGIHKERWIIESDIAESEEYAEVHAALVQCIQTPYRLSVICRNYLRHCLGRYLHERVLKLDLPEILKDYLTFKDVFSN